MGTTCLQFSNRQVQCHVPQILTNCSAIIQKHNNHLNHNHPVSIIAMFSLGICTGVLEYILSYTLHLILLKLSMQFCYRSLHQLCIVIVLHRICSFNFVIVAVYFQCYIYDVIM